MSKKLRTIKLYTDVLIIGGGTAGCYAALTVSRRSGLSVLIAEKANIRRSGCLAAGVNAINAYIVPGHTPQDYVRYAANDANGIVRPDLLLTAAERFNAVTADLEKLGLVILKNKDGSYAARGNRNIKINGENLKPLLAKAVQQASNVQVLNHVNMTDLLVQDGRVFGAVGFSLQDVVLYDIRAGAVLIATGGASGLYRSNNPGFSRHKMWYPPFNTGAGYAMGIRAGAEMTTFEMRFIALRCKDTIAPTGTIAQGMHARQVNARGDVYEKQYGRTTSERVYGTVRENQLGHGPCYLQTSGISPEQERDLLKAYLNMAPSQTLRWVESGLPGSDDVEIEGTEPYIVGGHTASGYWVNTQRESTIHALYAAGDVAGGCPQKYVTGALAEGEIAAEDIIRKYRKVKQPADLDVQVQCVAAAYETILKEQTPVYSTEELEEAMQKVMDVYAGGISSSYQFNEKQLSIAADKIDRLTALSSHVAAENMHELLFAYELKDRLTVCKVLIAHLMSRKETRWHAFNENLDYPNTDDRYLGYVNSRMIGGKLQILFRDLVKGASYEHKD